MRQRSLCGLVIFLLAASAAVAAPQHGSFLSNGVKIHYIVEGEGEPVLLIHGFSASAMMNWVLPGVFAKLAKHYHVIALDNRGHGGSGKPHEVEKYGPEMVEDVNPPARPFEDRQGAHRRLLDGRVHHRETARHPSRAGHFGHHGRRRLEPRHDDHTIIDPIAKSLDEGNGIAPLMKALTPPGHPVPSDEQIKARNQLMMANNDAKALSACIRGMLNLQTTKQQLEHNKVPVLAIIGELDPLKKGVDNMTGVMANLKVVVVPGGDHITTFQSPKFTEALNEFLREHARHPATAGR